MGLQPTQGFLEHANLVQFYPFVSLYFCKCEVQNNYGKLMREHGSKLWGRFCLFSPIYTFSLFLIVEYIAVHMISCTLKWLPHLSFHNIWHCP